jgi:hypothetical protein
MVLPNHKNTLRMQTIKELAVLFVSFFALICLLIVSVLPDFEEQKKMTPA